MVYLVDELLHLRALVLGLFFSVSSCDVSHRQGVIGNGKQMSTRTGARVRWAAQHCDAWASESGGK